MTFPYAVLLDAFVPYLSNFQPKVVIVYCYILVVVCDILIFHHDIGEISIMIRYISQYDIYHNITYGLKLP